MERYSAKDIGEFVNIGTGPDLTIRELAEMVKGIVGFTGDIVWDSSKPDGPPRKLLDISRMKSLGWEPKTGIERWLDERLPVPRVVHDQFMDFPTPRNLNYWWTFGGILAFMLAAQMATGVVLAMHYVPTEAGAFDSIEKIMRDVKWGWLLRYSHAVGASLFFVAVYVHTFRVCITARITRRARCCGSSAC